MSFQVVRYYVSGQRKRKQNTNIRCLPYFSLFGAFEFAVGVDKLRRILRYTLMSDNLPDKETQKDNNKENGAKPGGVGLERALERERSALNTLGQRATAEARVGVAKTGPCKQVRCSDQTRQPVEDIGRGRGYSHVGQEAKDGSDADAVVGHTLAVALQQKLRSLALLGHGKQVAIAGVQVGVGGRGSRSDEDGVNETRKNGDAGRLDSNNPGRSLDTAAVDQVGIGRRDEQADKEGTEDIEHDQTPENAADGFGNGPGRVVRLTGSDGHLLGTTKGIGGTDKSAKRPRKRPVLPVAMYSFMAPGWTQ